MKTASRLLLPMIALGASVLAGCAGVPVSSHSYNDSYKPNQPVKAEGCYEASVVLTKNLADTTAIASKVMSAVDAAITETTTTQIKAQRNRHIGLLVGSGGEELQLTFKPTPNNSTFVTVATKTGFVGGAGQKAWSCQIIDQMVKMAQ
jgi:PBP1b-binding outer membrane lipoprotein LpoB